MHTTLAQIRAKNPCTSGYKKLVQYLGTDYPMNAPISLATIAESNGAADAIWCFRAVKGFTDKKIEVINLAVARAKQYDAVYAAYANADDAAAAYAVYAAYAAAAYDANADDAAYAYADDAAYAAAAAADDAAYAYAADDDAAYDAYDAERKKQKQDIIRIFNSTK